MNCPSCNHKKHHVIDSRPDRKKGHIRRRRECLNCPRRFTTIEVLHTKELDLTREGMLEK